MNEYELLILVPGLVNDAAAEQTLDCLAALQPQPARIVVVDWSHDIRHGLARRRSPCLDDLLELADEVWSENLIAHKRVDPVGPPMWCCQCKAKAWAIGETRKRGAASGGRILYMQFGDRMSPTAPAALLATLTADPKAAFAFLQVYRCDWAGKLYDPPQFVHQVQFVREAAAKHKFMPGMMMAADRLTDTRLLDDRSDWVNQPDDLLTRQILLASGHGVGVPRSDAEHVYYYHAEPNPMGDLVREQFTRARKAQDPNLNAAGRPMLDAVLRDSDAAHRQHLAKRGLADRTALQRTRAAVSVRFTHATEAPATKGA